jgi:hypothetical protein
MTHLERLLRKRSRAIRLLEARLQDPEASASLFSVYRNLLRDQEVAVRAHLKDEAEKPIDWAAFMAAHPVPQDNPSPAPFPSLLDPPVDPPIETPSPSFSPGKIFGFLLPILLCLSASLFPARIHAQSPSPLPTSTARQWKEFPSQILFLSANSSHTAGALGVAMTLNRKAIASNSCSSMKWTNPTQNALRLFRTAGP